MNGSCGSERPWSYEEALGVLKSALRFGINPSLEAIRAICEAMGDPQESFDSIQVTGTNGKTSTARFTEALLRHTGIRTGLYTSPELQHYPERIEISGDVVSDDDFARAVSVASDTAEALLGDEGELARATEFELLTAAALWLFAQRDVEAAVLEVGMGGRWDATSVVNPAVAVITGVGIDHASVLGDTLEKIAAEKSAIIVPGSVAVLGPGTAEVDSIFIDRAGASGSPLWAVRDHVNLSPLPEESTVRYTVDEAPAAPGGATTISVRAVYGCYERLRVTAPSYQAPNIATAIAAAEALLGRPLDRAAVRVALAGCRLPGRFELISSNPPVVIDGAHNPQAAQVLAGAIQEAWPEPAQRPALLLGVLADKDAKGIIAALAPVVGAIGVTASRSPRAMSAETLAVIVQEVTARAPEVFAGVEEGLGLMMPAHPEGLVVSGSITVAGEARSSIG